MKTSVALGLALSTVLLASPSLAARKNLKSAFDSQVSAANGVGAYTYDDATKVLCGKVTYTGLTGGALNGAALKNSDDQSLVKDIAPGASPMTFSVVLNAAQEALLLEQPPATAAPGLYVALGNAANPVSTKATENGELNGELVLESNSGAGGIDQCPLPDGGVDGGSDAGTGEAGTDAGDAGSDTSSSGSSGTSSSGSSGTSSSGGSSSGDPGSSGGASSGDPGAPDPGSSGDAAPAAKGDDGGCSTTGSASTGGAFLAGVVALLLATRGRKRRS